MARKFEMNWDKIHTEIEKREKKSGYGEKDPRFYVSKINDEGNFEALIRFLPAIDNVGVPFVKTVNHNFNGPNGWYHENCPTMVGDECFICADYWNDWRNADGENAKKKVQESGRGPKQRWISNILVIDDPVHPENNGKVFLWSYGITVFGKIKTKLNPGKGSVDKPVQVFDYYNGCNFKIKIHSRKIGKDFQPQYDQCEFKECSQLGDGSDEYIEKVRNVCYPLEPFIAKTEIKSEDELKARFDKVMLIKSSAVVDKIDREIEKLKEADKVKVKEETPKKSIVEEVPSTPPPILTIDEDEDNFLKKLRGA